MPKIDCTTLALGRQAGAASLAAPPALGGGLCSLEPRNAAAWRDIARFLVNQGTPRIRYLGQSRTGQAERRTGAALALAVESKVPDGNHGDNLRSVQK
jgi:hypothetical protein